MKNALLASVAVLALAVGGVALSGVNLSNAITIPGTETQNLADRLKAEMPEAKRAEEVAGWTLLRDRTYGHTRLAVYKLETERQKPEEEPPKAEAGD